MRTSNRRPRLAVLVVAVALLGGCGTSAASPTPAPTSDPTPVITPDPHLTAPASVDQVFRLLGAAGLRITPNTATSVPGRDPVKRINATYASWPLVLTEFSDEEALRRIARFDPSRSPRRGESPYMLVGLNILVEFGPQVTNDARPPLADAPRREAIAALVDALDPLIGPLVQRSVDPVPLPTMTALPNLASPISGSGEIAP